MPRGARVIPLLLGRRHDDRKIIIRSHTLARVICVNAGCPATQFTKKESTQQCRRSRSVRRSSARAREETGGPPLNFIVLRGYSFSLFLLCPSLFMTDAI